MFIKRTRKTVKGKTYINHLLVESVATPNGPRHRVVCSLGQLEPAPREQWLMLARKVEAALSGQPELEPDDRVDAIVEKVREARSVGPGNVQAETENSDLVAIHTYQVQIEQAREAGPVHVGRQMWQAPSMDELLARAGLSERTRTLTELMALKRGP